MRVAVYRVAGVLLAAAVTLPASAQYGHPLKGSSSGDWGPPKDDRTRVLLDINWDGKALRGVISCWWLDVQPPRSNAASDHRDKYQDDPIDTPSGR